MNMQELSQKSTVAAFFTLGNKELGVCKELTISLQRPYARRRPSAKLIPCPVRLILSEQRLCDRRDQ